MRTPRCFVALSWVLAAGLCAACADEEDPMPSTSGSTGEASGGSGGSGQGGDDSGSAPLIDITGTAIDTYATLAGQTTAPRDPASFALIEAVVPLKNETIAYPGTLDADGNLLIAGVQPYSYYWLMMMSAPPADTPFAPGFRSYISNTSRTLDLGAVYSFRKDIAPITQPTSVTLNASLSQPWQAYSVDGSGNVLQDLDDDLQIVSFGADVTTSVSAHSASAEINAPADGAASLAGWTFDASRLFRGSVDHDAHLIDTSKQDDITVLHDVAVKVVEPDPPATPDPWSSYTYRATAEALYPPSVVMTDGAPIALNGAFEPLPEKTFPFNYVGSLFEKVLKAGPTGSKSGATVYDSAALSLRLLLTPRSPDPAYGSSATLLDLSVPAVKTWNDPVCNPDSCDPMACEKGCDAGHSLTLPGDSMQQLTYGDPFDFGQELGIVTLSFSTDVTALLPDGTPERLEGAIVVQTSAARMADGPVVPVLGIPLNVRVNNKVPFVDKITTGVGTTPLISFEWPTFGTPELFQIRLIELDDVIGGGGAVLRYNRPVASFVFRGSPVRIPDGLLQPGKHYYVQMSALATGVDRSIPFRLLTNYAMGQSYTGIFTP